ncbi:hypothetical protein PLICRDRAFT_175535 [Plicaturopsis crispa FD-325 SS-3]|nr:hypothetical protein PLICRDRAFT_175535 [Plicaturopsis crispa FD-325 SS-3]
MATDTILPAFRRPHADDHGESRSSSLDIQIDVRGPSEASPHLRIAAEDPARRVQPSYAMREQYDWGIRAPSRATASPVSPVSQLNLGIGYPSRTSSGAFATTPLPFQSPSDQPVRLEQRTPQPALPSDIPAESPRAYTTPNQTNHDSGVGSIPFITPANHNGLGISIPLQYNGGSPGKKDIPVFRPNTAEPVQWEVPFLEPGVNKDAQIWKSYLDEAAQQDKDNIMSWNQNMDVILVFVSATKKC